MSDLRAILAAPILRGLDCLLPASVLYAALYPVARARALLHGLTKGRPPDLWPPCLERPTCPQPLPGRTDRLCTYLNRFFEVLPERLPSEKWRSRCRFVGLENVRDALRSGQPVILAFAHFGPFGQLRSWLRAAGLPVAMLVGGRARARSPLLRLKDRWALFPEVPPSYYQDQMSAAIRHLNSGGVLAMAVDVDTGRQAELTVRPGWIFRMPTGPVRLARRHGAALVPCVISSPGPWRFQVELAAPVPREALEAGDREVCADLLARMLPLLVPLPSHWTAQLAGRFQPAASPIHLRQRNES